MKKKCVICAVNCLILCVSFSFTASSRTVHISDYGIRPGSGEDLVPVIRRFLADHADATSLELVFEPGRYDFYSEAIRDGSRKPTIAFELNNRQHITVDGAGAAFVFHGLLQPFRLNHSEHITLKNFSVDWDRPYNSQARIIEITDSYVDMEIDREVYPYEIVNDSIWFLGEGWRSGITPEYTNLYEPDTKDLVYQTRDKMLGTDLYSAKVTELAPGRVRFHFRPLMKPAPGTLIVFFHGRYITDGILLLDSKDVAVENVTIYHTLSCGVAAYRSENIALRNVHIINNDAKDRAFSTVADATHFNGCKGYILFEGGVVSGAGDDYMNIHGMYAPVLEIRDDYSVLVDHNDRYIGFDPGERAWIVDGKTLQRGREIKAVGQVKSSQPGGDPRGHIVRFDRNIRSLVRPGDLLENKDRNPSLTVRNCRMLKKNRGRSILATTTGDVLIEDNYFNSAGAAILIEGDTNLWYESGAVRNVLIRNNVFEDCYTSGNNIIDKPWGWGEAVISITPSVEPDSPDFPPYHRNIRIENNIFRHYDYALLFARSVQGLSFVNNRIYKTNTYPPFYRKANFYLDGCRDVVISGNRFADDFPGKNIQIRHMRASEVNVSPEQGLLIETP